MRLSTLLHALQLLVTVAASFFVVPKTHAFPLPIEVEAPIEVEEENIPDPPPPLPPPVDPSTSTPSIEETDDLPCCTCPSSLEYEECPSPLAGWGDFLFEEFCTDCDPDCVIHRNRNLLLRGSGDGGNSDNSHNIHDHSNNRDLQKIGLDYNICAKDYEYVDRKGQILITNCIVSDVRLVPEDGSGHPYNTAPTSTWVPTDGLCLKGTGVWWKIPDHCVVRIDCKGAKLTKNNISTFTKTTCDPMYWCAIGLSLDKLCGKPTVATPRFYTPVDGSTYPDCDTIPWP